MKILIAYHSKNGTSEKCAQLLLKQVGAADLADLKKKTPDFESYDLIVIGGSIRMGMYTRPVRKALKKYEEVLQQKKVIYFINCAFPENREKYYKDNISEKLRKRMLGCFNFGGEMDLARLTGSDRMIAATVARQSQGSGHPLASIDERAIEQCAGRIAAIQENI